MAKKLSGRDAVLLVILVVLVVGSCWYMFFYTPLQSEIQDIQAQSAQVDTEISVAAVRVSRMQAMQDEIDEILARPEDEITEIAPYDNATVIIAQLNGILSASQEYNLSFRDVSINDDGTVRRPIAMTFRCPNYQSARKIIAALNGSKWRCIVNSVSVTAASNADGVANVMDGGVEVSAQVTFFESKNLSK